jgi:hypothetical protein
MTIKNLLPAIIPFSDGRRLEVHQFPFGDPYSVRINVVGKRGSIRETFILNRSSVETILSLMEEL